METPEPFPKESNAFDVRDWLGNSLYGGTHLHPEAVAAVLNFTLMWNMFEGMLCPEGPAAFDPLAEKVASRLSRKGQETALQPYLAFWTFRYRSGEGFNERFENLHFRRRDRREFVEAVLQGEHRSLADQVLAILLITYRLRNNLFHGLKGIDMLNGQVENLNMAARALALVVEWSGFQAVKRPAAARTDASNRAQGGLQNC